MFYHVANGKTYKQKRQRYSQQEKVTQNNKETSKEQHYEQGEKE